MIDDDILYFYCLTGLNAERIDDPEEFVQILINTAVMAKDAGAKVFGFFQTDIRKYKGYDPFGLCSWIGTIIGIIGRKYRFRKDKFKVDIDYCLQNFLVERIVWMDNRYYAMNCKDLNAGGNATFRNQEEYNRSVQSLVDKWGECLKISSYDTQIKIKLNFARRQKLRYE